jgi:hypothetical protein
MAEKRVGRRAARRRSIEPGRIQALGEIVDRSGADGVLASDRQHQRSLRDPRVFAAFGRGIALGNRFRPLALRPDGTLSAAVTMGLTLARGEACRFIM